MEKLVRFIKWARSQPEPIRQQILVLSVIAVTLLIGMFWVVSLKFTMSQPMIVGQENQKQDRIELLPEKIRKDLPSLRKLLGAGIKELVEIFRP